MIRLSALKMMSESFDSAQDYGERAQRVEPFPGGVTVAHSPLEARVKVRILAREPFEYSRQNRPVRIWGHLSAAMEQDFSIILWLWSI